LLVALMYWHILGNDWLPIIDRNMICVNAFMRYNTPVDVHPDLLPLSLALGLESVMASR
jgi:hypothetical protein